MDSIPKVKEQFATLTARRGELLDLFKEITTDISKINKLYVDLVKTHHSKDHLFGLDSFRFQTQMVEMEYENINKVFHCVENRRYGEYYKVYKYVHEYAIHDIKYSKIIDKLAHCHYPVYKDLEPFKEYEFETLREMYSTTTDTITDLLEYLNVKAMKMVNDKEQLMMGIHIDNIVNSDQFTITLLTERIAMYLNYLEVINKHHTKYISRLISKCKQTIDIFKEDIQFKHHENGALEPESEIAVSVWLI